MEADDQEVVEPAMVPQNPSACPTMCMDSAVFGATMMSNDQMADWLFILSAENAERIKSVPGLFDQDVTGYFSSTLAIEFLFTACNKFDLSADVKFGAAWLFDRFMTLHVEDLYEWVRQSARPERQLDEWQKVENKITNQVALRILSCVQIYSKLACNKMKLQIGDVKEFLSKIGHCYTEAAIVSSEVRILKTMDFKLAILFPVTYVETLLAILDGAGGISPASQYQVMYQKLLDFMLIRKDFIYQRLFSISTQRPVNQDDRLRYAIVQADYMLMASGVLGCTALMLGGNDEFELVCQKLHGINCVAIADMMDFAQAILQELMKANYLREKLHDADRLEPLMAKLL